MRDYQNALLASRIWKKRAYALRKKNGACIHCCQKTSNGHTACEDCLGDQRMRMKLLEAERQGKGDSGK